MNAGMWTVVIMASTAAITAAGWAIRHVWRIIRRTGHFMDDYFGQDARDGLPAIPGVMARLTALEKVVQDIRKETQPNEGTSMRDVVTRAAQDTADTKAALTALAAQLEILRGKRDGKTQP